jgi:hypothetical protein
MDAGDAIPGEREEPLPVSLEAALLEAAADLPDVVLRTSGQRHDFLVGSRVVASLEAGAATYRLDPAVVAAALRTPDTRRSGGASDEIVFAPRTLDRYAADRAVAWLGSAVRRAGA